MRRKHRIDTNKLVIEITKKFKNQRQFCIALSKKYNKPLLNLVQQLSKIKGIQNWWITDTTLNMYLDTLWITKEDIKHED